MFARILFNKYIAEHSCECININGNARAAIVKEWGELESQMDDCVMLESREEDEKMSGDFEHKLYCLFDPAFSDVFHNLEQCLSRFRSTAAFRVLKKRRMSKV